MIAFLEIIYFIFFSISVISFLIYIYKSLRKQSDFKYFLITLLFFVINIFIDNELSNLVINEIKTEINNSNKIIFINDNKNQIEINKNSPELKINTSSRKHSEKKIENYLLMSPKNIRIILKEDSKSKGKFWIKYPKYYFSNIKAIGYLEVNSR
ncbi:hypothetical protein [Epilithonimonas arachidiradicis]|uniref:Uncharacterized protein n=1 Tax=Epilithonimonas arachidiradicis TaxID=1617282 RepID=A0A420DAL0_9FLAO|nr:hypothetical protein [Epilithonimonas arachidiradicis]RKE88166.1 hypothetical protein BXY58_1308 [Epilithonimonas arachidiradicis]GGG50831.1 hypothetical protein GCM10007332_10640 [Epilithonimonas arachidiradicis]